MAAENMNPIALRSKNWIVESLFDLLAVKPLNRITISEIAENAELDRRTFYRHFTTKEEAISFYIHDMSKQYVETMISRPTDNYSIAKSFFEICVRMKETLRILHKQNLLYLFLLDLNVIFPKYQQQFASAEELGHMNREYILAYHIGGFWNLLVKWLEGDCRKTPEQMGEIVVQMFSAQQI